MVAAVMKVLTIAVVVLLVIVIVPLLGPFVTNQMPEFAESTSRILNAIWDGFVRLLNGFGYGN